MKIQEKVIVLIRLVLFLADKSFAQQVKADYDRAANFSQYKAYSWEKVQTADPLWVDRIKAAVNAALAAKGWTQVQSGGDISIIAMEINRDHQTLNTYYDDFGGGWRWCGFGGFGEATTTSETYTVGRLLAYKLHANGALEGRRIWTNDDSERPSDYRPGRTPLAKNLARSAFSALLERGCPVGRKPYEHYLHWRVRFLQPGWVY